MSPQPVVGYGTKEQPWTLTTPSGDCEFQAYRDGTLDPPAVVVIARGATLRYHLSVIADLYNMLKSNGGWVRLGSADGLVEDSVEGWALSPGNARGGWYGLSEGHQGDFGNYLAPVMEALDLAEVEHSPWNNRMRAL